MKRNGLPLLVMLIPFALNCGAMAQTQTTQGNRTIVPKPDDRMYQGHQPLKKMPSLPNFPMYTGKGTFLSGTHTPKGDKAEQYLFFFSTQEHHSQVSSWYRTALSQAGWRLGNMGANTRVISAVSKKGERCSITVNPGRTKEEGALVSINFTDDNKDDN